MDAIQVGGVGRDHRTVGGRVDGDDPAHSSASRAWLSRVPGSDAPGQALPARAHAGCLPAGTADWQHLLPQRQRHLEDGLDKVPLPLEAESLAKIVPIQHANLRGAAYYRQTLMEA